MYVYNTLAFSWAEAQSSCLAMSGNLSDATNATQRQCALQNIMTHPRLSHDPSISNISTWVNCPDSRTCDTDTMCPTSNPHDVSALTPKPVTFMPCDRVYPYTCVIGKQRFTFYSTSTFGIRSIMDCLHVMASASGQVQNLYLLTHSSMGGEKEQRHKEVSCRKKYIIVRVHYQILRGSAGHL